MKYTRILLKYVRTCLERVLPVLSGLLLKSPLYLVFIPSCKAA